MSEKREVSLWAEVLGGLYTYGLPCIGLYVMAEQIYLGYGAEEMAFVGGSFVGLPKQLLWLAYVLLVIGFLSLAILFGLTKLLKMRGVSLLSERGEDKKAVDILSWIFFGMVAVGIALLICMVVYGASLFWSTTVF